MRFGTERDELEGMCEVCAGGVFVLLRRCLTCMYDELVDAPDGGKLWVSPDHPLHPWYVVAREEHVNFDAAMVGQAYPYEEYDNLDFPPRRHPRFRTPGALATLVGCGQPVVSHVTRVRGGGVLVVH